MIPEYGLILLIMAFVLSLIHGTISSWKIFKLNTDELAKTSIIFCFAQCFLLTMSFISLVWAFIHNDFSVHYVAQHSNTDLPLMYKIGAVWGGHEGSLLLWALILSVWTLSVAMTREIASNVRIIVQSILSLLLAGFLGMILCTSNPFKRLLPEIPIQGADLNPLLQDITFMIHPPLLYIGYVGLAVPFAFAMAECISKTSFPITQWITWVRRSALFSIASLTLGITLGSWWAYYELGWGGWWFWDPVENASLMPWIVGIAYLHIIWVAQRSAQYTTWRILLAITAFLLSLLGTFLTRSGVISTVHAFTSDTSRGVYLLSFLSLVTFFASMVYIFKLNFPNDTPQAKPFSKSSLLFLGSILWVISAFSILLGTLYPLLLDTFTEQTVSIGPPYFNTVITPIWGGCLLLMTIAPTLRFLDQPIFEVMNGIKQHLFILLGAVIFLFSLFAAIYILSGSQKENIFSIPFTIGLCIASMLIYFTLSQTSKIIKQPHRIGYWMAHLGVGVTALGILLSTALESEKSLSLSMGEKASVGEYEILLNALNPIKAANFEGIRANFDVISNKQIVAKLTPEKRYFKARDLITTETSLGLHRWTDFTIALGEPLGDDRWTLRIYIKPFVRLIWAGGIIMALGMMHRLWMLRKKKWVTFAQTCGEIECKN